jgi:hypothetical protein
MRWEASWYRVHAVFGLKKEIPRLADGHVSMSLWGERFGRRPTKWADREAEAFRAFGTLSEKYAQARVQSDLDTVAVVCGEAVGLLRDRPTAESIVKSMAAEAADLLRNGGKLRFPLQS